MAHIHNIIDTDSHFVIDTVTRAITTKADKLYVVQYDHDSERFTFQLPRYVEEHDMSLCNRIEVHYSNTIRTKKEHNEDVYIVKEADCFYDNDTFFFSWLISGNATQLVGYLIFSVTFLCFDENGNVSYEWGTTKYEDVQVLAKFNNTAAVQELYPDLYLQLKQEILDSISTVDGSVNAEEVERIIAEYLQDNPPAQGEPGEPGFSPTITTTVTGFGYKLTVTDVNGTYVADILHGTDGKDGVSPTIDVTEIENGHVLTITDVNGTKTVTILNGSDAPVSSDDIKSAVEEYLAENPIEETTHVVEF